MLEGIVIVSGTGTGVGKTVTTAAVAAMALARRRSVAVVKPAQTGVTPDEPGDLAEVRRLSGADDLHEMARYRDALSPEAAARREGRAVPALDDVAASIAELGAVRDLVLVEGAGGLLVRFGDWTVADLAKELRAPVLVVTAAGLGTLNDTTLTLEALAARDVRCAGVVIGAWPTEPDLAARSNLADLTRTIGEPPAGALAQGAATAPDFRRVAEGGLGARLGGTLDPTDFVRRNRETSGVDAP